MAQQLINQQPGIADRAVRISGGLLVATVWLSALLFGLYILSFYFVALLESNTAQWNEVLPGLFDPNSRTATVGIGLHFAAGGVVLILGCTQLIGAIREGCPAIHRWVGRIYVSCCLMAALGGLLFIAIKGTIGGLVMDIGFAGYGVLMAWVAIETFRHARARRIERHRAWAIRLFALAIGSWLYRMDYGFWFMFTGGLGHTADFSGPFDHFMAFFFYVPNLLVAEAFIGRTAPMRSSAAKWAASICVFAATMFLVLATYYFTKHRWGPAIVDLLT
ncbi:MAG: hypothetical protein DHS20C11_27200 [Lysobacteraceae bacterium]|nr:MAG: hypothetical protein DHS20C11_27200 [Xanthomonadaceae bacterium]